MSVLYRQSIYEDKIVTQSLNVANMFLTSSNAKYWAGKNNHHGVIISFDWMPSSGSLKLLEANTNIEITLNQNLNQSNFNDNNLLIMHGDSISGAGSNVSITKAITSLRGVFQYKKNYEVETGLGYLYDGEP